MSSCCLWNKVLHNVSATRVFHSLLPFSGINCGVTSISLPVIKSTTCYQGWITQLTSLSLVSLGTVGNNTCLMKLVMEGTDGIYLRHSPFQCPNTMTFYTFLSLYMLFFFWLIPFLLCPLLSLSSPNKNLIQNLFRHHFLCFNICITSLWASWFLWLSLLLYLFFKFILFLLFIYLTVLGLSCGMWDLLVGACKFLFVACGM